MARCMLIDSKLSESFWAKAINTSCHIKNRCPTKILNGEVPRAIWTKCKAFYLNMKLNKGKFAPRSEPRILVSYSEESKAYRVWPKEEKKVNVTRGIKFLEDELEERVLNEFNDIIL